MNIMTVVRYKVKLSFEDEFIKAMPIITQIQF